MDVVGSNIFTSDVCTKNRILTTNFWGLTLGFTFYFQVMPNTADKRFSGIPLFFGTTIAGLVACDFVLSWYNLIADLLHVILFCHDTTLQLTYCMWFCFATIRLYSWLVACDFVLPRYDFTADLFACDFVLPSYDFLADLLHATLFFHDMTL